MHDSSSKTTPRFDETECASFFWLPFEIFIIAQDARMWYTLLVLATDWLSSWIIQRAALKIMSRHCVPIAAALCSNRHKPVVALCTIDHITLIIMQRAGKTNSPKLQFRSFASRGWTIEYHFFSIMWDDSDDICDDIRRFEFYLRGYVYDCFGKIC